MANIYKRFAKDWPNADFGDKAACAMFEYESRGTPIPQTETTNGFALGKKWMDITVSMWNEDIKNKQLFVFELIKDGYPIWFLNRVLEEKEK